MPAYFSLRDVYRAGLDPTYRRAASPVALAMFRVCEGSASAEDAFLACCHGYARDVAAWARRHPRAQAEPLWSGLRRWRAQRP